MSALAGLRVAVTRAESQNHELAELLEHAGAHVLRCPLIRIETQPYDGRVHEVLRQLPEFHWIVFTSVNGVEEFMRAVAALQVDDSVLQRYRVACVGPATAAAAQVYGFRPNVLPPQFVGAAVAAAIIENDAVAGLRILLPRAAGGGAALPEALRNAGAEVYDLPLYRSVMDENGAELLRSSINAQEVDLITFTSGSAIKYFVEAVGTAGGLTVAVIGPSTAAVAQQCGLRVDIEARTHTSAGLVEAILEFYAARRGQWRI